MGKYVTEVRVAFVVSGEVLIWKLPFALRAVRYIPLSIPFYGVHHTFHTIDCGLELASA